MPILLQGKSLPPYRRSVSNKIMVLVRVRANRHPKIHLAKLSHKWASQHTMLQLIKVASHRNKLIWGRILEVNHLSLNQFRKVINRILTNRSARRIKEVLRH